MAWFIPTLIGGAVGSTLTLAAAIIIGTFILEDVTVVIVGLLAAEGVIGIPLALISLYAGIVLGDIGLYWLGRYASTHPRLEKYVDHDILAPFRNWLEKRNGLALFSARFVPGMRLPTYTASGFFGSPFSSFVATAVVAASVWTLFLFSAAYWFGSATEEWLGPLRLGIAGFVILILLVIGPLNFFAYRTKSKRSELAVKAFRRQT